MAKVSNYGIEVTILSWEYLVLKLDFSVVTLKTISVSMQKSLPKLSESDYLNSVLCQAGTYNILEGNEMLNSFKSFRVNALTFLAFL